jgi:uncharacterized protein
MVEFCQAHAPSDVLRSYLYGRLGHDPPGSLAPIVLFAQCSKYTPEIVYNYAMSTTTTDYDPRYLAGIVCFNQQDFFEAHEVWEDLWMESAPPVKRFYQSLIQAAVALYHFGNGNLQGALKLYGSSKAYMDAFASPYLGLDIGLFWQQMERCFAELHATANPDRHTLKLDDALIPQIALEPPPESWPDPADFVSDDAD